jgi:hypothetical protein
MDEWACDISFITEIVSRNPISSRRPNIFRDDQLPFALQSIERVRRGVFTGNLRDLATICLAKLHLALEHGIHPERLLTLWKKQCCPGRISTVWAGIFTIRMKTFQRWVKRNATRICATRRELDKLENEDYQRQCDEYDYDVDLELDDFGDTDPLGDLSYYDSMDEPAGMTDEEHTTDGLCNAALERAITAEDGQARDIIVIGAGHHHQGLSPIALRELPHDIVLLGHREPVLDTEALSTLSERLLDLGSEETDPNS